MNMRIHAIEISTEVYRLCQERGPQFIQWQTEKRGPTQKLLLADDVYNEFVDRAIAHRQTFDEVIREVCRRTPVTAAPAPLRCAKRFKNSN